jgi:hypothetical protein
MSTVQEYSDSGIYDIANNVTKMEFRIRLSDGGTVKYQIYKGKIMESFPDEETQLKESLDNLASGNYRDVPIEEYLKELE